MPRRRTRRKSEAKAFSFVPGTTGLDLFTHDSLLPPTALRTAEHVRLSNGALERRPGSVRLDALSASRTALSFGAAGDYGVVTAATHMLIPRGGFAVRLSFKATRPSASNTAYLFSSRASAGKNYGWLTVTLSDAGVSTWEWRKESDESAVSIASTAHAADATVHALFVFDADAGTTTLYIDGVSDGTPVTGISSDEQPMQDAVDWWFGANHDGSAVAVANTEFLGDIDAWCVFAFRNTNISEGSNTLLSALKRHTLMEWPNPRGSMVVSCFDFNDASVATEPDRSRHSADITYSGTPTKDTALARSVVLGQHVGVLQRPTGERVNLIGWQGRIAAQTVRQGVA